MKILLALGTSVPYFPPQIPQRLCFGKDYPYNRMGEVVNIVEAEGLKNRYRTSKITKELLAQIPDKQIYSLMSSDEFFYCKEPGKEISQLYRVYNVNTSIPWRIEVTHDGGERVKYFDKPDDEVEIIDRELNYAREI